MEVLSVFGLDIVLADECLASRQSWTTLVQPGVWSGLQMRGTMVCGVEGLGETTTGPDSLATFQTVRPLEFFHHSCQPGPLSAVFVRVTEGGLADLLGEDGAAALCPARLLPDALQRTTRPAVSALAWQMLGLSGQGAGQRLYLAAKALEFLAAVIEGRAGEEPSTSAVRSASCLTPRDHARVMQARDLILSNLKETPSVPDLARAVGLNATKLTRGFDRVFGMPVYAFIKNARLTYARELIESGTMTVSEAAYAAGYHPATLSTAFHRHFGIKPSQARRSR
ncbi:helix-turn-helix domain-containing protein [Pararhodospirillum oryzae]|uniref:HTH araC/xylS-type domain-containing protein n=1 Tax=Pararhodospirillum oryzae TaxID=478448 RepID=A0A512HC02_9PROT|nr:AraC family transcriptional regulator [Pararhodospirillum oryzae]GEO82985.1 hypothetical protein ROR02_31160 [Pararhodospirillum oryzae]